MEAILLAILGFFALGTWGFWLGVLFLSVVYTVATETDNHGFSIFCTLLFIGLFWKVWALISIPLLLIGVGIYAVAGGIWSVYRWFRYCRDYVQKNPISGLDESDLQDYVHGTKVRISPEQYYQKKLRPSEHKSRLIGWITYWPWSVTWNIAGDLLTTIYDSLVNVYQKTATAVIKKALGATTRG